MYKLSITISESDIEQLHRIYADNVNEQAWDAQRVGQVQVECLLFDANNKQVDSYNVDGALVPIAIKKLLTADDMQQARSSRTFFYLNGVLRALVSLRMRHPDLRVALQIETGKNFLSTNATLPRIAKWKKRAFTGANGQPIQFAVLWNNLYDWMTAPFGFQNITFV